MATDDGWTLPQEAPTWDGPYFGLFDVLADVPDGETVQCHICVDWFAPWTATLWIVASWLFPLD